MRRKRIHGKRRRRSSCKPSPLKSHHSDDEMSFGERAARGDIPEKFQHLIPNYNIEDIPKVKRK